MHMSWITQYSSVWFRDQSRHAPANERCRYNVTTSLIGLDMPRLIPGDWYMWSWAPTGYGSPEKCIITKNDNKVHQTRQNLFCVGSLVCFSIHLHHCKDGCNLFFYIKLYTSGLKNKLICLANRLWMIWIYTWEWLQLCWIEFCQRFTFSNYFCHLTRMFWGVVVWILSRGGKN